MAPSVAAAAAILVGFICLLGVSAVCLVGSAETLSYLEDQPATDTAAARVKKWQVGFVGAFSVMATLSLAFIIGLVVQIRFIGKSK